MADYRRIELQDIGDVVVVRFVDRKIVDDVSIQEVGQELYQLVEVDGRKKVLLDFGTVEFLSSAALGKLITLDKKASANGAAVKFCDLRPGIHEVFTITRLDRLFDIHEDRSSALAAF